MKNIRHIRIGFLLVVSLSMVSNIAFALIRSVSPTINNPNVAIGYTSNRTITWTVEVVTSSTSPTIGTITSPTVTFRETNLNGAVLGIISKPISRAVTSSGFYPLLDNLTIPSSVIYSARKRGASRIVVIRTFSDAAGTTSTSTNRIVTLHITGSSAAGFGINAVSVRFDNNQPQRVIKRSKQHKAYIKFTYNGSGLLKGVWEIASPTTTIGKPVFRPLRVIRQYLPGTGTYKLYSPRLPTRMQGVYLVRFRITSPGVGFTDPLIRYFVYTGKKPLLSPVHIFLLQPGPSTAVHAKTIFSWNKIKQANVLRLELYAIKKGNGLGADLPSIGTTNNEKPQINGRLIAGKLLRGSENETKLSQLTLKRLKPGQWYLWRLVAFNKAGNIIGISEPRKVYAPAK